MDGHLIAGEWVAEGEGFASDPATGEPRRYASGTAEHVDRACAAAEAAFEEYGWSTREDRARFLEAIAEQIDARGDAITAIGTAETGLPEARLQGERGRTMGQLRLFAEHVREGGYLDRRHDAALPGRAPLPRPELTLVQRPIGPVAVFGASNFPLAFSVAGGDTASALAAGCPVVVKGHPAHPGTGQVVAEAIDAAREATGMPAGVFSMIHGDGQDVGAALVRHPLIRAVGFTGSLRGGKALFDLCARREEPIPFYGELGSVNPVFVLDGALEARGAAIAEGWAGSLTMGAGQFCTNPGIVVLSDDGADAFLAAAGAALEAAQAQVMLTPGIAGAYADGLARIAGTAGVTERVGGGVEGRACRPAVFETTADVLAATPDLAEEVFGPVGIVVRVRDAEERIAIARGLEGQLTCALHMEASDHAEAARLVPILERKAGRILANGFPTGVEVADAMVHGGPYPASTNFGHTSVGTLAIRRWLRPVCYQDMPEGLVPEV